jgi:hypothetical protein
MTKEELIKVIVEHDKEMFKNYGLMTYEESATILAKCLKITD